MELRILDMLYFIDRLFTWTGHWSNGYWKVNCATELGKPSKLQSQLQFVRHICLNISVKTSKSQGNSKNWDVLIEMLNFCCFFWGGVPNINIFSYFFRTVEHPIDRSESRNHSAIRPWLRWSLGTPTSQTAISLTCLWIYPPPSLLGFHGIPLLKI